MTLIRWKPILSTRASDLAGIHNEIDRMFDGIFSRVGVGPEESSVFAPAVDVEEGADEFVVRADLPGISQKDVKVHLLGDTLTIRGERQSERENKDRNYHRVERRQGVFERSVSFSAPVRSDAVRAQYRDGVLEVHVPKAEEARVRDIEIQVAS